MLGTPLLEEEPGWLLTWGTLGSVFQTMGHDPLVLKSIVFDSTAFKSMKKKNKSYRTSHVEVICVIL